MWFRSELSSLAEVSLYRLHRLLYRRGKNPDAYWVGVEKSSGRVWTVWRSRESNYDFSVTEPIAHSLYRLRYAGFTLHEIKKKIVFYFYFSLSLIFFLLVLLLFALSSSPSCYSLSFPFFFSSYIFFFRFSFPTCQFHVLIIPLLLHVPFSPSHSDFLIPLSFQSLHFLSSLCHSHYSNAIIVLHSPHILSLSLLFYLFFLPVYLPFVFFFLFYSILSTHCQRRQINYKFCLFLL